MEDQTAIVNVSCKTLEGMIVEVPLNVIRMSRTFDGMYRDLGLASDSSFIFPVAIKTETFKKVMDWCKNHIGAHEPLVKEDVSTRVRIWFELTDYEKNFFDVPVDELCELITAANYLDVKSLYLLGCQSLASLMKDKSPEEVRTLLGIQNDLTVEEVQEIRKQNVWCNY